MWVANGWCERVSDLLCTFPLHRPFKNGAPGKLKKRRKQWGLATLLSLQGSLGGSPRGGLTKEEGIENPGTQSARRELFTGNSFRLASAIYIETRQCPLLFLGPLVLKLLGVFLKDSLCAAPARAAILLSRRGRFGVERRDVHPFRENGEEINPF